MGIAVDPGLLRELKRYGAPDISACFHCGNCTAVCPLSDAQGSFPRRLIRLGQLGARSRLLSGPEPWLCYYCGECSETCPRQANPGEYMAAVRRYATAASEPTGLAGWMFKSSLVVTLVTVLLGLLLGAFVATARAGADPASWIFPGVSYEALHLLGMAVSAVAALIIVVAAWRLLAGMLRGAPADAPPVTRSRVASALKRTAGQVATMARYREDSAQASARPWFVQAAWVHQAIMLGFLGLLLATSLDFLFLVLLPLHMTIFWPARILGTLSGVLMLYGVTVAIARRWRKVDKNVEQTSFSDAWLLFFLFLLAVTGFWLEVAVTWGLAGPTNDLVLVLHSAMAMELVLLLAFTKLAHVLYRPMALFVYYLQSTP